ncbi:hypothetical protein Bca101_090297 [Brassica carinata]
MPRGSCRWFQNKNVVKNFNQGLRREKEDQHQEKAEFLGERREQTCLNKCSCRLFKEATNQSNLQVFLLRQIRAPVKKRPQGDRQNLDYDAGCSVH